MSSKTTVIQRKKGRMYQKNKMGRNATQSMMNHVQKKKKTLKLKETFLSKNGKITWSSAACDQHGRPCDAKSSYASKMQVYTGKPTSGCPEKNQGMRVVLDVTEGLRGHNVTCDNCFTSYELRQKLLKRKITMVGTVRKNKPELPPALLASKEREVFSS